METEGVLISLPLFRIGFSTQSVYETHESSDCDTKKIKYTADSLLRRYSANCEVSKWTDYGKRYCVKNVRILSYSGPYSPSFGPNTERCSVSFRIQSECGKIRTRITPNTDTFYSVGYINFSIVKFGFPDKILRNQYCNAARGWNFWV